MVAGRPHPPAVVGAVIFVGAVADEVRGGDGGTVVQASKWWEESCWIPSAAVVAVELATSVVAAAVNVVESVTVSWAWFDGKDSDGGNGGGLDDDEAADDAHGMPRMMMASCRLDADDVRHTSRPNGDVVSTAILSQAVVVVDSGNGNDGVGADASGR